MKKFVIILIIIFSVISCERTDMYDDATSYASIYAWFSPDDCKIDASSQIYKCEEKDGRSQSLYNGTPPPILDPTTFNSKKSISFSGISSNYLISDSFLLTNPMTIIFAMSNCILQGPIIGNSLNTNSLVIKYDGTNISINDTPELSAPATGLTSGSAIIAITIDSDNYAKIYLNNTLAVKGTLSSESVIDGLLLGSNGASFIGANLGDIIFFNKVINEDAREYYVNLLKEKYNI